MQPLEKELYDKVTDELHELTWFRDYPINPSVGIWCMLEAFKEHGVDTRIGKEKATFSLEEKIGRKRQLFESTLTFNEIAKGWNQHPLGSPKSLYDSICIVYDKMGEETVNKLFQENNEENMRERNDWYCFRNSETKKVERKMEPFLIEYFSKYQEHMLVPVSNDIPKLGKPEIFHEVLKDYPMEVFRKSFLSEAMLSPCADYLLELDWNDLDFETYYPSRLTMFDFFWGKYLEKLTIEKGYTLNREGNRLKQLLVSGASSLTNGQKLYENMFYRKQNLSVNNK